MANTHPASPPQVRARLQRPGRAIRSMTERQLDAYLQARDTLRRLRAVATSTTSTASPPTTANLRRGAPPPVSPA